MHHTIHHLCKCVVCLNILSVTTEINRILVNCTLPSYGSHGNIIDTSKNVKWSYTCHNEERSFLDKLLYYTMSTIRTLSNSD